MTTINEIACKYELSGQEVALLCNRIARGVVFGGRLSRDMKERDYELEFELQARRYKGR